MAGRPLKNFIYLCMSLAGAGLFAFSAASAYYTDHESIARTEIVSGSVSALFETVDSASDVLPDEYTTSGKTGAGTWDAGKGVPVSFRTVNTGTVPILVKPSLSYKGLSSDDVLEFYDSSECTKEGSFYGRGENPSLKQEEFIVKAGETVEKTYIAYLSEGSLQDDDYKILMSVHGNAVSSDGKEAGNGFSTGSRSITLLSQLYTEKSTFLDAYGSEYEYAYYKDSVPDGELGESEMPAAPYKKGYCFTGWKGNKEGKKNVRFSPEWRPAEYKIRFNAAGGEGAMEDEEFFYDESGNLAKNTFTRDGYTFGGWSRTPNGDAVNFLDGQEILNLSENDGEVVNVYAVWNKNTYSIVYRGENSDWRFTDDSTVKHSYTVADEDYTVPVPEKTGYTFTGWSSVVVNAAKKLKLYTSDIIKRLTLITGPRRTPAPAAVNEKTYTIPKGSTGNIELTAGFDPNKYTISYISEAKTIASQGFVYDDSDVISEAPARRQNYVFTGWKDQSGKIHMPGDVVRNWTASDNDVISLNAQWMAGKDAAGESAKDAEHSHVWVDNYDEHYHWKECSICGTIQSGSKQAHTLQTTGSCYRMNDNGGAAMRQVCTACGYKSKPLYAILGKWENYSNYYAKNGFASSNYYDGPGNLNNVQQISYSEFRSRYGSYKFFSGQPCTWADPDGDGFGWVFGGGFVITRSKAERNNGMRSTLDLILGSANTHPAPNCEDEFPEVYRILRDGRDSGKSKFLDNLTYKESTNARSYLYGIREKYQDISSSQWKQIVSMLAGYTAHKSGWGWSSEDLIHPSAMNSGNTFYGHSDYDSSKDRGADFSNGISTHCDVCGADYDGYEAIRRNWYICSYPTDYAKTLKDGKVHECGGHTVYGKGWTPIATIYDSYQMSGNNIVEVSRRVVTLQDGVSWSLDTSDDTTLNRYIIGSHNVRGWTYPYDSTFTYDGVTTNQACGYYYPNSDITNPSSISVSDVPSKTANVNGVTWVISTKMTVSGYDGVDLSNAYESIKHIVHISLSDGSKTLYEGDAQCNSSNYFSLTFTPEMEADSSGKTFTIQVTDPYGNSSSVQKVYRNIDAKLPDILNTEDYTGQWSTYKTITLKAADTGAGHVKLGINNVSNLQECTLSSDGKTYTRDYTFGGDVYSDDAWAIFAQDAVGNLASKSLHIGLIDNTAPTITNVTLNGKSATITANDENAELKAKGKAYAGSGIVNYGYLGMNDYAITWSKNSNNIINLPSSGRFYIFARDRVGNISKKYAVNVA